MRQHEDVFCWGYWCGKLGFDPFQNFLNNLYVSQKFPLQSKQREMFIHPSMFEICLYPFRKCTCAWWWDCCLLLRIREESEMKGKGNNWDEIHWKWRKSKPVWTCLLLPHLGSEVRLSRYEPRHWGLWHSHPPQGSSPYRPHWHTKSSVALALEREQNLNISVIPKWQATSPN